MSQAVTVHPVISEIRSSMISEGYSLFESYESEIERFTEGLVDANSLSQQNIAWASQNLRDIENLLKAKASGTFMPRLAEVDAFGKIREYMQSNGGLDALTRWNTAMFSLEIDGGRYDSPKFVDVSASNARTTQKTVFKDAGYVIKNRQGYSFFEYGRNKGDASPFRIYFSPFNLKKNVSRMSANLVCRTASQRELIVIPDGCLFPCLSHYQLFSAELAPVYRIDTAKLFEDRTRLHLRLLEMLMKHLNQWIDKSD